MTQSSAHRKLIHGAEQAKLLLGEAAAYRRSDAYTFDHEKETLDRVGGTGVMRRRRSRRR